METPTTHKRIYSSMIENTLHFAHKIENQLPIHQIRQPLHRIQQQLELYNWRNQHKSYLVSYQWTKINPCNQKQVIFQLKANQTWTSLDDLRSIRGTNLLKNIGKIFTGFKILYDKFGPFEVTSQMIAFDPFFDPMVWMCKQYIKNQYKREHISQEQFGQNILQILLKHQQKFQNPHFLQKCWQLRGQKYSLEYMENHFIQPKIKRQQSDQAKTQASNEAPLNFSRRMKKKCPLNRKNSNYTKNLGSYHSKLQTHQQIQIQIKNPQSLPTSSTLAYLSKPLHELLDITPQKQLDNSFFVDDQNFLKPYEPKQKEKLHISVNMESDQEEETPKELVILPMLDQYSHNVVNSIINPTKY